MKLVDIGGIALNIVVDDAAKSAPWVTFSNSHATDLGLWDAQAALLQGGFRILRYDTRGHGASGATPGAYDFDLLTSDVVKLWDALGIEKSALVGLSLGGTTSLELAARVPQRVTAVLAADCRDHVTPAFSASWDPRIGLAREQGMEALVPSTIERWFTADFRDRDTPALEKVRCMIRRTSVDGYIGCAEALKVIDVQQRLGDIRCPVKMVTGRHDPSAPPELIAATAARIQGATTAVIESAAHITNVQQPEAFNRELMGFLKPMQ
ncbi:MAG: hypothetical protein RLZ98_663 [Pseudomonadota bacterium]|jgi:3-oxoadipate enol-lactonase